MMVKIIEKRIGSTPGLNPGGNLSQANSGFEALRGLKPLSEDHTTRTTLRVFTVLRMKLNGQHLEGFLSSHPFILAAMHSTLRVE